MARNERTHSQDKHTWQLLLRELADWSELRIDKWVADHEQQLSQADSYPTRVIGLAVREVFPKTAWKLLSKEHRAELVDRLIWSVQYGGEPTFKNFDWDDCRKRIGNTIKPYLLGSEEKDSTDFGSDLICFLHGTSSACWCPTRGSRPLLFGRNSNDFRRGFYLFPDDEAGHAAAAAIAYTSALHEMKGGTPLVVKCAIRRADWAQLVVHEFAAIASSEIHQSTPISTISKSFQRLPAPRTRDTAHIWNYFDVLIGPMSVWSESGWTWSLSSPKEVVFRKSIALSRLRVVDVLERKTLSTLAQRSLPAAKSIEDYTSIWSEIISHCTGSTSGVALLIKKWKELLETRFFQHEHPSYYTAPLIIPAAKWQMADLSSKLDILEFLELEHRFLQESMSPNPWTSFKSRLHKYLETY